MSILPYNQFSITGALNRPLLKAEILDAQAHAKSAAQAARYLKIDYKTYKKWAQYYGIFKTNQFHKEKRIGPTTTAYKHLELILNGRYEYYDLELLRDKLINTGMKRPVCENCGYNRIRKDGKAPLRIYQKDGDRTNYTLENLEFKCFNCIYLSKKNGGDKLIQQYLNKNTPQQMMDTQTPIDDLDKFKEDLYNEFDSK